MRWVRDPLDHAGVEQTVRDRLDVLTRDVPRAGDVGNRRRPIGGKVLHHRPPGNANGFAPMELLASSSAVRAHPFLEFMAIYQGKRGGLRAPPFMASG